MHLKTLTLKGFKSFATATSIALEPGITCVVGPNGSGKSNVVDALAWVMGEQGAKNLRGGQMSDVIFAGTAKRAPLGRAEAQLTIDNSDGQLDIDYTEVTISRTMFTSGGSEYAINGSPARLLDVQELLSDTGMGRQMHVIVGQGQLDRLFSATDADRRAFIEEAAGVLKHRNRKDRALRKIASLDEKLTRLQDLTHEVGKQLGPLARQAENARRSQIIQAVVRDCAMRILAADISQLQDKQSLQKASEAEVNGRLAQLDEKIGALKTHLASCQAALDSASPDFEKLTQHWQGLTRLAERLGSLEQVAAERSQTLAVVQGQDFAAQLQDMSQRKDRAAAEVEQAEQAQTENTQLLAQIQERLEGAKQAEAQARADLTQAARAEADRRESLQRLRGAQETAQRLVGEAEENLARWEESLAQARERAAEAAEQVAQLGPAAESKLSQSAVAAHEAAGRAAEAARAKVEALQAAEREAAGEMATWKARRDALEAALAPEDASAAVLEAKLPGLGPDLSSVLQVESGWENAVAALFGPYANALVATTVTAAADAIRHSRESATGQVHLIVAKGDEHGEDPGQDLPELPAGARWATQVVRARQSATKGAAKAELPLGITQALAGVALCEELAVARELVESGQVRTAITKQGDLLSTGRAVGGAGSAATILAQRAAFDEAAAEAEAAAQAAAQAQSQLSQAREDLQIAEENQAAALAQLRSADAAAAELASQRAAALAHAESAQAEVERQSAALERARGELAQRQQAAAKAAEELSAGQENLQGPQVDEEALRRALAEAEAQVQAITQEHTEANVALRVAEEGLKAARGRLESLTRNLAATRAAQANAEAAEIKRQRRLAIARYVQVQAEAAARAARQAQSGAGAARESAQASHAQYSEKVTQARQELEKLNAARAELNDASARDQVAAIETQVRLEALIEQAQEEYGTQAPDLVAQFGPHQLVPVFDKGGEISEHQPFVREQVHDRLRKAKADLERLGKVNPLALAEHEALAARHQFLADQLADLKASRADLMHIVGEVDRKVVEVFGQAYQEVAEKYQEVFGMLFPGGQGRLVLTDPDDLLQTGIEIEASPAGKRVKRLSLLSGGERSLAAMAFLVAIFMARPSPFYVLDEVEAALDDANLTRLLSVFEKLKSSSQLIIITHHKRTMEIADALYGVTMREGVTTVVSQRLKAQNM